MSKTTEMVGGCSVCSDEHGWAENPLVYCDGKDCNVAVHQACYGIVTVPKGNWYCQKCESSEKTSSNKYKFKCELCPCKDGAIKKTDSNGWAHVVCALYIPEVRFGNVTTMEPITLAGVPQERFNKTCYICSEANRGSKATSGACMPCNKTGCKQQFHVTCAQALGLLCEETGNQLDNVRYCGYCQHHSSKMKKGGNVKVIPPYKPIALADDSSPEKETTGKKKSYLAVKNAVPMSKKSVSPSPDISSIYNIDVKEEDEKPSTLKFGTTSTHSSDTGAKFESKNKFTTSNFVETTVTPSDSVFGSEKTDVPEIKGKKRKTSAAGVKTEGDVTVSGMTAQLLTKTVSVSLSQLKDASATSAVKPGAAQGGIKAPGPATPTQKTNLAVYGSGTKITIATSRSDDTKKSKTEGNMAAPASSPVPPPPTPQGDSTESTDSPVKRSRSGSQEKGRKKKSQNRRVAGSAVKDEPDSPPGSPEANKNKKKLTIKEEKDIKPLVTASYMLGNQLNPSSSMAQTMNESINQEEVHSIYKPEGQSSATVAPAIPRKYRSNTSKLQDDKTTLSAANSLLSLGNSGTASTNPVGASAPPAAGLEQLLERHWEQGHQFLMEQAEHFDIGSLLNCLQKLKQENMQLEDNIQSLTQRRDHLLAVNARLTVPLVPPQPNNPPPPAQLPPESIPEARTNGGDAHAYPPMNQMHISSSPPVRTPMAYPNAQRRPAMHQYQNYTGQVQNNQHNMHRRDDHQM